MGSQSLSRGRFGRFLFKRLESAKFQELEWINKEQKTFRISWLDKRKTGGKNDENPIFKEWEMYSKRHKEGDQEDWTKWKHTFHQALGASPDVHYVPELSQEKRPSCPFKVYRFDDGLNLGDSNPFSSLKSLPRTCVKNSPESTILWYDDYKSNIPNVVADVLRMGTMSTFDTADVDIRPVCDVQLQQFQVIDAISSKMENNVKLNESVSSNGNVRLANCLPMMERNNNTYSNLNSDDLSELFKFKPKVPINLEMMSLPSLNTPDMSMESVQGKVSLVGFKVFYSNYMVLEDIVGDDGVHLLAKGTEEMDFSTPECVNCPKNCIEKKFPEPDILLVNNIIGRNRSHIFKSAQLILNQMGKGIFLYFKDGKLFIRRLCHPRVYAWNNMIGTIHIDTKNWTEQQLFDMNIFQEQLKLYKMDPLNYKCPTSTVILTFGEKLNADSVLHGKIVMRLELTFIEAEELLQRELPEYYLDLQFSIPGVMQH